MPETPSVREILKASRAVDNFLLQDEAVVRTARALHDRAEVRLVAEDRAFHAARNGLLEHEPSAVALAAPVLLLCPFVHKVGFGDIPAQKFERCGADLRLENRFQLIALDVIAKQGKDCLGAVERLRRDEEVNLSGAIARSE